MAVASKTNLPNASDSKPSYLPIGSFGPINKNLNVPQRLLDGLEHLKLDPMNWIENIEKILSKSRSVNNSEMIEILADIPKTSKDAILAFVWFFRGAAECDVTADVYDIQTHGTCFQ